MAPTPRPESRPPDRAVPVEASKFTRYPEVDFSQFLIAPGPGVESEVSGSHVAYLYTQGCRTSKGGQERVDRVKTVRKDGTMLL